MRSRLLRAAVAATAVMAMTATSAGAWSVTPTEENGLSFIQEDHWFQPGTTPIGNLNAQRSELVTWGPAEPTGDVPSHYLMNNYSWAFAQHDATHTFTTSGTFTGHLDTMAISLFYDGPARALCGLSALSFDLTVDGKSILYQDQTEPSAELMDAPNGDYGEVRFMFTRMYERMLSRGIETGPDVTHEIRLNIANFYICHEAWIVYGSADAPSSVSFNVDPDSTLARSYTKIDVYNPPPPLSS